MIQINWLLNFLKYDKNTFFFCFIKKMHEIFLEFDRMHTNKNIFFYFLDNVFLKFFWNLEEKKIYLISGQYHII